MKKVDFYVVMYLLAMTFAAACLTSCAPTKSVVNPCEHFVNKGHKQNPHDLLPYHRNN